jgi:hypothetical protein
MQPDTRKYLRFTNQKGLTSNRRYAGIWVRPTANTQCSTIICHRFDSPLWWKHLKRLVALDDVSTEFHWFDKISRLKTGEGVIFCPLTLGARVLLDGTQEILTFGRGCMVVKIRKKLTATTGESILSLQV